MTVPAWSLSKSSWTPVGEAETQATDRLVQTTRIVVALNPNPLKEDLVTP